MSNPPMSHSIRTRILGILGALAVVYLLLCAMVQTTAGTTRRHMERVSASLFPASHALDDAEHSYAQARKEYKDSVTLEDQSALSDAQKSNGMCSRRWPLRGPVWSLRLGLRTAWRFCGNAMRA